MKRLLPLLLLSATLLSAQATPTTPPPATPTPAAAPVDPNVALQQDELTYTKLKLATDEYILAGANSDAAQKEFNAKRELLRAEILAAQKKLGIGADFQYDLAQKLFVKTPPAGK